MRALVSAIVLASACTPEITAGTYMCGPEESCPDGFACNGPDNICVLPSAVTPFACAPGTEVEPNNSVQNAQLVASTLTCASREVEVVGCAQGNDQEDWFAFEVPASCATVAIRSNVGFPTAFEQLDLELRGSDGAVVATGMSCGSEDLEDGEDHRCMNSPLVPGQRYTVRVARSGEGDCAGECSYNRYLLTLQLTSP